VEKSGVILIGILFRGLVDVSLDTLEQALLYFFLQSMGLPLEEEKDEWGLSQLILSLI